MHFEQPSLLAPSANLVVQDHLDSCPVEGGARRGWLSSKLSELIQGASGGGDIPRPFCNEEKKALTSNTHSLYNY